MTSSNAEALNKKYIIQEVHNEQWCGQIMSCYETKFFVEKLHTKLTWKLVPDPFVFPKK